MATPHLFDLPLYRFGGHDARIVEGCFDADGKLGVNGLTDISDTPFGRRVLADPVYSLESRIERLYLGPHPAEVWPDDEKDELILRSIATGAAWLLNRHEGVMKLIPVSRNELRIFEDGTGT